MWSPAVSATMFLIRFGLGTAFVTGVLFSIIAGDESRVTAALLGSLAVGWAVLSWWQGKDEAGRASWRSR